MLKTQNKSSIVISKTAFLDDMLPEPHIENLADYGENPHYNLSGSDKLLELIKKLAAKVLTEEELVNILGDKSLRYGTYGDVATYEPTSKEIPH